MRSRYVGGLFILAGLLVQAAHSSRVGWSRDHVITFVVLALVCALLSLANRKLPNPLRRDDA